MSGIPTPRVVWKSGEAIIVPNEHIQTSYNETTGEVSLILIDTPKDQQATYTIEVENEFGRAVSQAEIVRFDDQMQKPKVKRLKAPQVTPLKAQTIRNKATLRLTSPYTGIPSPEVKWFKNGKEIVFDDDTELVDKNGVSCLTIKNMDRKRAGKYEIVATNEVGESRASGSIMVSDNVETEDLKAPQFVHSVKPKSAILNEIVILEGLVESHPLSSFQWFLNSMPIKLIEDIRIHSQNNKSTLIIDNFTPELDGIYTCRAENVAGSVSSSATVKLVESESQCEETKEYLSPRFVKKLKPAVLMDGEPLKLTCRVIGYPIPKVVWMHNKHVLTEDKGSSILQDLNGICELNIPEAFVEDSGIYSCKATNKLGKASTKANVVVEGIILQLILFFSFHFVFTIRKNKQFNKVTLCTDGRYFHKNIIQVLRYFGELFESVYLTISNLSKTKHFILYVTHPTPQLLFRSFLSTIFGVLKLNLPEIPISEGMFSYHKFFLNKAQ